MKIVGKILKVLTYLPTVGRNLGILSLLLTIMALLAENLVRFTGGGSILAPDEIGGLGMVLFVFLPLAWVYQKRGHLRMGWFADKFPRKLYLEFFLSILSFAFVTWLIILWWDWSFLIFQTKKFTVIMEIPNWPFYMAVVFAWVLFLIAIVERAVHQVKQIFGKATDATVEADRIRYE